MDLIQYSSSSSSCSHDTVESHQTTTYLSYELKQREVLVLTDPLHLRPHLFGRTQPHVPGNWKGHVFINLSQRVNRIPLNMLENWARFELLRFKRILERCSCTSDHMDGSIVLVSYEKHHLHISLSRPFYLQYPSLSSFQSDLTNRLKSIRNFTLDFCIPSLEPEPSTRSCAVEVLVNDEQTRSFLVLRPLRSFSMTGLIHVINDLLDRYDQKPYHEECKVHVSIASMRGNVWRCLSEEQRELYGGRSGKYVNKNEVVEKKSGICVSFRVDNVCCDFGNMKKMKIELN